MKRDQVLLDVFLGEGASAFLGHRAPEALSEARSRKSRRKNGVIPAGCHPRCYYADPRSPCRCRCGGAFHGHGYMNRNHRLDEYAGYELIANLRIIKFFEDKRCLTCGHPLKTAPIYGYEHPEGVEVDGKKLWIFAVCQKCGYQNSLRKIMAIKEVIS